MSIEWKINLHFDRLKAEVSARADQAVIKGAEALRAIVTPLVPVETGRLVGSGDVGFGLAGISGPALPHTAHLYFSGPYALYQHEGVYFRKPATFGAPLTHNHGQNFFLIQPLISHRPEIVAIIGTEVKKAI